MDRVDSPVLVALHAARALLQEANLQTLALRRRVEMFADATDWSSRATEAFRAGVASLADRLAHLVESISLSDDELAATQRDELARLFARSR